MIVIALVLGAGGAALALGLQTSAATSTFVSSSSPEYRATQRFYESFGEEPVEVLIRGNLQQLVLSSDIERVLGLEDCLAGIVPSGGFASEGGRGGPCGELARARTVKVVFGPGTFLREAASVVDEQLNAQTRQAEGEALQAEKAVYGRALARHETPAQARALAREASRVTVEAFQKELLEIALRYGITSAPSLTNANFVSSAVFDSTKAAGTPKERFAYVFPNRNSALISVRMKAGLHEAQRNRTIALVRSAVAMPEWHLAHGESYVVTGVPVIAADLPAAISHSIELLLVAVALVMAATLGLIFSGRPRLLPLGLAVLACALTFGALALEGSPLTMASIAVLPVLVGLAVDYAIQFQSRVGEALEDSPEAAHDAGPRAGLVARAAGAGAPTIVTAGAASAAAMLALLLSPVPMVRGFGLLLVVGVAIALACALTVGAAAVARVPRQAPGPSLPEPLLAAWRGAGELLRENPLTRALGGFALGGALRHPGRTLSVGLALAALGWGLDTQTSVQTDITKLVPQNLGSVEALDELQRSTGVGGQIDLMVSGRNLANPATIEWMSSYERAVLAHAGYSASRGCGKAPLCPAFSLPDLFEGQVGSTRTSRLSASEVRGLLKLIPPDFSQDVITPSHRVAALAFGIRAMSLQRQERLIEEMRAQLHPPAGVAAALVGLPVLAARSGSQVADPWRRLLTLIVGLAAVAIVLLLAFRGDGRRALIPLVPIVLATGWSALVLFAVRVPLNPMSVTLGALVIAISTEFSVLLSERHRQERLAGNDTISALRRAYSRTGAAVVASGVTATAGFGVLALSQIAMLRNFGLVTLIDLSASLIGVLVALPAVIVIADRGLGHQPARARGGMRSRLAMLLPARRSSLFPPDRPAG